MYSLDFTDTASLLALRTAGLASGIVARGTISGAIIEVQLLDGNQETGGSYWRPVDWIAGVNQRVWVQLY